MIKGVIIKKIKTHSTESGYFREIVRDDDNILSTFGQVSVSKIKAGAIKAFHWHKNQDDIFYVIDGRVEIVLYDRRKDSTTFKETQVIIADADDGMVISIPKGIAHGYKVIGKKDAMMLYIMNKSYNPKNPDEERISYDDPEIGYNWKEH